MNGYDNAIVDTETALAIDSSQMDYYLLLSNIYLNYYKSREALEALDRALAIDNEHRPTLLALLELQISLRQYPRALGTSQLLLKTDAQDPKTFFLRGILFKEQNIDSLAIVNFQRAVDLDPGMTDGFILLGDLHEKKSDPLAKRYYENAVKSDETNVNAWHALAYYQQNHEEKEAALDGYKKIISLDSTYSAAFVNLGILQMDKGSIDDAIIQFQKAIGSDTKFATAHYFLGLCFEEKGEGRKAFKSYEKAVKIDPDYMDAVNAFRRLEKTFKQ